MTRDELLDKVREIIPTASLSEDHYGQIVIYTNLHYSVDDDNVFTLED